MAIHLALFPLVKAIFAETNPGPIKRALFRRGMIAEEFRLPLVPVGEKTAADLDRVMEEPIPLDQTPEHRLFGEFHGAGPPPAAKEGNSPPGPAVTACGFRRIPAME